MLSNRIVAGNFPDVLLASIPQSAPFRFVDHVIEIDEHRVKAAYRFRGDEFFYEKNELVATATIAGIGVHIA